MIPQLASHPRDKIKDHRNNDQYQNNRDIGNRRCIRTPLFPSDCQPGNSSWGSGKKQRPDPLPLVKGFTVAFEATSNQTDTIKAEGKHSGVWGRGGIRDAEAEDKDRENYEGKHGFFFRPVVRRSYSESYCRQDSHKWFRVIYICFL